MLPGARPADYDQTLKRLLTQAHDGFLALLLPGAQWVSERSPELTASLRQADLVWEVALAGTERLLLHIELQTGADAVMGERLAEYAIRLWREYHLPVRSVVVYLRETGRVADTPFVIGRGGGDEGLRYPFDVVRLWQEPAERVLSTREIGLWPLAALMAGATAETTVVVAERIARAPLPRAERSELTGLLAVLAGLRMPRQVVDTLLRRNPMIRDLIEESSYIALIRDEAREKGREQGREEGREQGREEGREEGREQGLETGKREMASVIVAMAQSVLESRFGALQPDELAALGGANEARLRGLAKHVATDSRDQLRSWLGLSPTLNG